MLILNIDSKQLIPVRLIPFITGWYFSPDVIAEILAKKEKWHKIYIPSYHLLPDTDYAPMLPKEWDVVSADMNILRDTLKHGESVELENYPQWREQSIQKLPAETFVWLQDLEDAWNQAYSAENVTFIDERPGDRDLNLNPYLPKKLWEVIYDGFQSLISATPASESLTSDQYINFNELHHHMQLDLYYGELSDTTGLILKQIYRDNLAKKFYSQFKQNFSLLPCKSDKQRELIYIWCGLMDLPSYKNDAPLDWQYKDFLSNWTQDFKIQLNELKTFLRKHSWPLPSALFPEEVDNTDRKVSLSNKEFERAFHDFAALIPQLRKELKELESIQPESMDARNKKRKEIEGIRKKIDAIQSGKQKITRKKSSSHKKTNKELSVGSPEWRKQNAKKAADARHNKPGGSREKQKKIREIWASGKYTTRDICAEEECAALDMSFSAARKALINTPAPKSST